MSFKYAIALTGSIATGKSSVATIFKSYGFDIIDADMVAHKVLDDNYMKISDIFGKEYILDNRVDRKRLGTLIFSNKDAKKRLEHLLHPLIFKEIERLSIERDRLQRVYIIDIPLFFETNRYPISRVIVVYTPQEIQLQRLIDRDKLSKEEALKRVNSQIDIEEKKIRATYLIDNSKDLKFLQQECDRVKREMLNY